MSVSDFIYIKRNSVTSEDCKNLIQFYYDTPERHVPGLNYGKRENKISTDIQFNFNDSKNPEIFSVMTPFMQALRRELEEYKKLYACSLESLQSWRFEDDFNFQHYKPGEGYFAWHCESGGVMAMNRKIVWMFYLNDVPNGGTEFINQNVTTEAREADLVIWPADWTHTHRGQTGPDIDKDKYILTGWFIFDTHGY